MSTSEVELRLTWLYENNNKHYDNGNAAQTAKTCCNYCNKCNHFEVECHKKQRNTMVPHPKGPKERVAMDVDENVSYSFLFFSVIFFSYQYSLFPSMMQAPILLCVKSQKQRW